MRVVWFSVFTWFLELLASVSQLSPKTMLEDLVENLKSYRRRFPLDYEVDFVYWSRLHEKALTHLEKSGRAGCWDDLA